jgi:SOS-response transcriptional repressor LexA
MLETTSLNKCYKMVVLRVLLDEGRFFRGLDLPSLARACRRFLQQHETLRRDLEGEAHAVDHNAADDRTWEAWWNKWPVDRWLNPQAGQTWFVNRAGNLQYSRPCPADLQATLEAMTGELVDWRLTQYSVNRSLRVPNVASQSFDAKVSHANGRPILFLPDKARHPDRPVGPTRVWLPDGTEWVFKLVKIACNVAGPVGDNSNQLPELLRTWFGPQAGLPGTTCQVRFQQEGERWTLTPVTAVVKATDTTFATTPTRTTTATAMGEPAVAGTAETVVESEMEPGVEGADATWASLEPDPGLKARYRTHVPVYDLTAAAGGWGPEGSPTELGWLRVSEQRLAPGMFVARVVGRSMEPRIPDGAWCLFRPCPAGSRQGRLLLVQVNTHLDPEDGGRYTVKQYYSRKNQRSVDWDHDVIELRPLNPEYGSITVTPADAPDLRIIGEFVTVVEDNDRTHPGDETSE